MYPLAGAPPLLFEPVGEPVFALASLVCKRVLTSSDLR
jgi:hypothetical protein